MAKILIQTTDVVSSINEEDRVLNEVFSVQQTPQGVGGDGCPGVGGCDGQRSRIPLT